VKYTLFPRNSERNFNLYSIISDFVEDDLFRLQSIRPTVNSPK